MFNKPLTFLFTSSLLFLVTIVRAQTPLSDDSATIFVNDTDTLYTKVDSVPRFPGGKTAWMRYLVKTLRYPFEAQDDEIMGETRISFTVDVDGTISNIHPVMGDPILTKESVRLIEQSGKWEPAVYQGQKVKAIHIQPITYRLEFDRGGKRKRKR